ncbi:MAG: hypothetical protein CL678_17090 [Bdellovibrionaceae bacterium]|nr:hypothetical protein [Pseudobdellovibrionaceae bacterium]|tara:strand:+ start:983 stop:2062 length:1080 start_codon:yes stop_codon:yes gene_type:complete
MGAPAQKQTSTSTGVQGPQRRILKKGELLFSEGENSRAMYFIKRGMIRIFKKKGQSQIEIDTIRSGAVLGELAFLDGNPRSASGEALTDCELIEVSAHTFTATLNKMPDWLKILLKTIVGRLRSASTRIKQLEQASTAIDYSSKGSKSTSYVYLSPHDVLKICTSILLSNERSAKKTEEGTTVHFLNIQKYANSVMGVPVAKTTTLCDALTESMVLSQPAEGADQEIIVKDPDFLERFISYSVEENLAEPSKRHDLSIRGFIIMTLISKYFQQFPKDDSTGLTKVNIAEILELEKKNHDGKDAFRIDEFVELEKLGYCSPLNMKAEGESYTDIDANRFSLHYRFQKLNHAIQKINENHR